VKRKQEKIFAKCFENVNSMLNVLVVLRDIGVSTFEKVLIVVLGGALATIG